LSVITNIGWDHMNLLGSTLTEIAGEKAGIIKSGIPIIIGEYQPEVAQVFLDKAQKENSTLIFASKKWDVEAHELNHTSLLPITATQADSPAPHASLQLNLDLTGTYQLKNVKTVLAAVNEMRTQGFNISNEHVEQGLSRVQIITGLQGRWQTLNTHPLTICDTGHNPDGMEEVLKNIAAVTYKHLHFVIGMVNDKDITKVLSMLPKSATYYFCKPDIPRGLEAEALQQQAAALQLHGQAYPSVKTALQAAQQQANINDLVFAGGSTFVVAEIV
jgi:dihydrofolate synthase/folylpolyglutamate synthase